ncbi:hypothetical protein [Pseudomonas entomophila]|uniref:hypothetical protein n=1 Tax=Pseudomonas entomophila TaxID=312306 RepID=UPI001F00BA57|nr:hypothetical protein [Pseudomonas entomophila]MCG8294555.1 hypothetical protein [Pseudomonas entomophila]
MFNNEMFSSSVYFFDENDKPQPVRFITGTQHHMPGETGWLTSTKSSSIVKTAHLSLRFHIIDNYMEYLHAYVTCNLDYMFYLDDFLCIDSDGDAYIGNDWFRGHEQNFNQWKLHHTGDIYEGFDGKQSIFTMQNHPQEGYLQLRKRNAHMRFYQATTGQPTRFVMGPHVHD